MRPDGAAPCAGTTYPDKRASCTVPPRTVGLTVAENHGEHHNLTHAYRTHAATAGSADGSTRPVDGSRISWSGTPARLSGRGLRRFPRAIRAEAASHRRW